MPEISASFAKIKERYPLVTIRREWAGREFSLTCVRDQDALLAGIDDDTDIDHFPFGMLLWASAIGLAERLVSEPALVQGKRVLEIGAGGVGLPGLIAAHRGAAEVIQTDYHDESLDLLAYNATQNGFADSVRQARADWRDFPELGQPFDIVLGSDVLYERSLHPTLAELLPRLVSPGGVLLLADPMRPQALAFMDQQEKDASTFWELPIAMQGKRVEGVRETRDIALFSLRRSAHSSNDPS